MCGKAGHRAAECYSRAANAVEGEEGGEEGEEVELGGIWHIGAVEAMAEE